MKHLLHCVAIAAALAACGGIDRATTRDNLVEVLEENGYAVDVECIELVLEDYTDKELERIAETLDDGGSSAAVDELNARLIACASTAP